MIDADLYKRIDATNRATIIGWGLFFTAADQVRAVQSLHRSGACSAAAPNRRSALEHVITLRWCVDQGDRIADIYNRKLRGDQIQLAKTLKAEGSAWYSSEGYETLLETVRTVEESVPADPNERLAKIDNLLDGYGLLKEKAYYQVESRFVHPTPTGIQMFFSDTGDVITLSQISRYTELVACDLFCLVMLYTAMSAFNEVLAGRPWSDGLRSVAMEHDLPSELPRWRDTKGP